jgi:hypothetical protein
LNPVRAHRELALVLGSLLAVARLAGQRYLRLFAAGFIER